MELGGHLVYFLLLHLSLMDIFNAAKIQIQIHAIKVP